MNTAKERFKVGDRVRLSEWGKANWPKHPEGLSATVIGFSRLEAEYVRVRRDGGNSRGHNSHMDYWERITPTPIGCGSGPELTETIQWIDASDASRHPDPELTVLLYVPAADEPIWLGYRDEDDSGTLWFWADGSQVDARVTHWAQMPAGPIGGASCPK